MSQSESQSNPVAEKKPLNRTLHFLAMLGMTTSAFFLIIWGGTNVLAFVTGPELKYYWGIDENKIFQYGLLSYLYGMWVATAGLALLLNVFDIYRAKPLPIKLRVTVGAALFAAMTITAVGSYGATVDRSEWTLDDQRVFKQANTTVVSCPSEMF